MNPIKRLLQLLKIISSTPKSQSKMDATNGHSNGTSNGTNGSNGHAVSTNGNGKYPF
jgi:hypothetical protein